MLYNGSYGRLSGVTGMSIDDELKAAGMLTVSELMEGHPLKGFLVHRGVNDIDKFSQWLDMRTKEMLDMKARMNLDKRDDDLQ